MLIASPVRCCDCERKSKRSSLSSRPGFIATSTPNPCRASPVSGPCFPPNSSHPPRPQRPRTHQREPAPPQALQPPTAAHLLPLGRSYHPSPPRIPHLLQPETPRGKEPQTSRPHPRQTTHQHNLDAPARRNKIPSDPTHPSTNHNLTSQLRFLSQNPPQSPPPPAPTTT